MNGFFEFDNELAISIKRKEFPGRQYISFSKHLTPISQLRTVYGLFVTLCDSLTK